MKKNELGDGTLSSLPAVLDAAVTFILDGQNPDGSWTDFYTAVGTSDSWVTAYIGRSVEEISHCRLFSQGCKRRAVRAVGQAAEWLLAHRQYGWGYNTTTPPDADSTAHVLSFLSRLSIAIPHEACTFLEQFHCSGTGYRTYRFIHPDHAWNEPSPDITAAVLRALNDVQRLSTYDMAQKWHNYLGCYQDATGLWNGYWWYRPFYTTGMALSVWERCGKPVISELRTLDLQEPTSSFDVAWQLISALILDKGDTADRCVRFLLAAQLPDGSWQSVPELRIRPHHRKRSAGSTEYGARDGKRLFTTATALSALIIYSRKRSNALQSGPANGTLHIATGLLRSYLQDIISKTAINLGFSAESVHQMRHHFELLTQSHLLYRDTVALPQLSSLAAGVPLEFSVKLGQRTGHQPLRYAADLGNPSLPPYKRAVSALADIKRTVAALNYQKVWWRIQAALPILISHDIPVPNDLRFWIWAGMVYTKDASPFCMKLYFNLLHNGTQSALDRLFRVLDAVAIPVSPPLTQTLQEISGSGFPHEIGFALGTGGQFGCKIYFELPGWNSALFARILKQSALNAEMCNFTPEISGLVKESLAKRMSSGIAVRVNSADGTIEEVTLSTPFPPALIPVHEICNRLLAWIERRGWNRAPLLALTDVLLQEQTQMVVKPFSLITQTIGKDGSTSAAIYIKPLSST